MPRDNFSLPDNAHTYINTVKDRCHDLIQYKIWTGVKSIDLRRWLNNFSDDLESYFAACILDALIYRSSDQTISLASELFTKKLPAYLNNVGFEFNDYRGLVHLLQSSAKKDLRLVSVAFKNKWEIKSSNVILREYKRKLSFNENWFIHPDEIEIEVSNGVRTFIFIDDFLGTGTQFNTMYKLYGFQSILKDCNKIYSPLVSHIEGQNFLNQLYPNLVIISAEYLDSNHNVFNYAFNDGINTPMGAKTFYDKILNSNEFNLLDESKYGIGNLGLSYTFSHSSPDNCLNIIWDNNNGRWHPLIAK